MFSLLKESFQGIFNNSIEIIERKVTIAEQARDAEDYLLALDLAYGAYQDAYELVESILTFKQYTTNQELVDSIREEFFEIATRLHDKAYDLHREILSLERSL